MQSVLVNIRKDDLIALALGVREAVLHLRTSLASAAHGYPHEGQDALTRLLALHLESLGHEVGISESTALRSVLLVKQSVVDLSFKGERAPLVEIGPRHSRQGLSWPVLSGVTDAEKEALLRDLSLVQAFLARPTPDLRLQPFVPVVDRWWGMDVLECGHLMTSRAPATRCHSRRCLYCAPVQAASTFRVVADPDVLDWFASLSDAERGETLGRLRNSLGVASAGPAD